MGGLEVHHIKPRGQLGHDMMDNLITLASVVTASVTAGAGRIDVSGMRGEPATIEPETNGNSEKSYVADSSSLLLRHRSRFLAYFGGFVLNWFSNLNL
jgi:hypothetical protein